MLARLLLPGAGAAWKEAAVSSRSARSRPDVRTRGSNLVTAEQIVEAAVRICDRDGIDALTIRRLASDLDIGTMTLYGYFRGKEDILDGVADHVLGRLEISPARERTPTAVAHAVALSIFAMMREHPSVVYLLSSRSTMSKQSLKAAMDAVLGILREAGFTDEGAVRAYALIMTYCLGFASYQLPRPWGPDEAEDVEERRRQQRHFYSSLPLPDFNNMVELSELITTMPSDDQFEFGLDCAIAGLVTRPGILSSEPARSAGRERRDMRGQPPGLRDASAS
jgi:AcrR family transcriptional regulator